jgi:hypothetical protein
LSIVGSAVSSSTPTTSTPVRSSGIWVPGR